jgi:hypothetical protein
VPSGFPLTHVELGKSFAVVSGHDVEGTDWGAFSRIDTLVLLMAGTHLERISSRLRKEGWAASTPVSRALSLLHSLVAAVHQGPVHCPVVDVAVCGGACSFGLVHC